MTYKFNLFIKNFDYDTDETEPWSADLVSYGNTLEELIFNSVFRVTDYDGVNRGDLIARRWPDVTERVTEWYLTQLGKFEGKEE